MFISSSCALEGHIRRSLMDPDVTFQKRVADFGGHSLLNKVAKDILIKGNCQEFERQRIEQQIEEIKFWKELEKKEKVEEVFFSKLTDAQAEESICCYLAFGGSLKDLVNVLQEKLKQPGVVDADRMLYHRRFAQAIYIKEQVFVKNKKQYFKPSMWQRIAFFVANTFWVLWFLHSDLSYAKKIQDIMLQQEEARKPGSLAEEFSSIIEAISEKQNALPIFYPLLRNLKEDDIDNPDEVLSIACEQGEFEAVQWLVNGGGDVNLKLISKPHKTPLSLVFVKDQCDLNLVRFLLQKKANPNGYINFSHKNSTWTPLLLDLAGKKNKTKFLELLLSFAADVNCINNEYQTALHRAANSGCLQNAKVLLRYQALVNQHDLFGRTPVHELCSSKITKNSAEELQLLRLFKSYGADFAKPDNKGNTPVQLAIENCKVGFLRELFKSDKCLREILNQADDLALPAFQQAIANYVHQPSLLVQSVGKERALRIALLLGDNALWDALNGKQPLEVQWVEVKVTPLQSYRRKALSLTKFPKKI